MVVKDALTQTVQARHLKSQGIWSLREKLCRLLSRRFLFAHIGVVRASVA